MSTKIYDGLRINTDDIFDFTNRLHTLAKTTYTELAKELVMEEITNVFDGDTPLDSTLFYAAAYAWEDEQSKISRHNVFEDPLRFSLVMGKTPDGKILAYPYYSRNEYFDALMTMPEVSSYGYWNNTDQEDGVTDEQWDERRRDWDSLLEPSDGTFAHLPLYELSGTRQPFTPFKYELFRTKGKSELIEQLVNSQPSPETRLRRAFQIACVDSFTTNPDTMMSDVSKAMRAARDIPVKDMGELPPAITVDDLYNKEHSHIKVNLAEAITAVQRVGLTPKS